MSKEQSVKTVNHLQVIERNTKRFFRKMGINNEYFCIISPYYQNAFSVDKSSLPEGRKNLESPYYTGLLSGEITWEYLRWWIEDEIYYDEPLKFALKENGEDSKTFLYDEQKEIFHVIIDGKDCGVLVAAINDGYFGGVVTDGEMTLIRNHFFEKMGGKGDLVWIKNEDFVMKSIDMNGGVTKDQFGTYYNLTKSQYILMARDPEALAKTPKKIGRRKQN